MAYADRSNSARLRPIIAVGLVHAAIGYAFISGLAQDMVAHVPAVFKLIPITEQLPPPPNVIEKPQPRALPKAAPAVPTIPRPMVETPATPQVVAVLLPPLELPRETASVVASPTPPVVAKAAGVAQGARAKGDRTRWISSDDYPARSLRNGEEGAVAITARIGADGRVTDCAVTASSGFPALDEATCRLYSSRARFAPARDADGVAIASTTSDRIRWTVPE